MPKTTHVPNLPIPPGATTDDLAMWSEPDCDGDMDRSLVWSRHDAAGVGVSIDGMQSTTGYICRHISLYDAEGKELTGDQAIALGKALIEAGEEWNRLEKVHPIAREEA